MSTSSNGKKAEAKRAELVAAAVRVVMREGIGAASVRAVAQEAQISVGSVLYYFSGIDELLRRTVESVMDRYFAQRLHVLASSGTAAQRLARLIDLGVPDDIGEDLSRLYKSIALKPTNSEDLALYEGLYKRQVSLYLSIIETGQDNGEFTPEAPALRIAQNLIALEDAYDLYPVIGVPLSGAEKRANVRSYAELALGCTLQE
ncbi:TetR family transcriptional regulator [Glutamicibacter sp. JL.03c]|uniref:TetR/AcrR family transcriptional regulator n=1 Tax=Glutamicibacter sp. JL.03c TaxID=2984842 RepID=UPI0021F710AF|nr:TetR family transcriptional regulator [Glutamicibacter sp. JL.03c]UYQ77446.1 TetR family transcriptional regulator [Glutamicibacter sp. JL.03c]